MTLQCRGCPKRYIRQADLSRHEDKCSVLVERRRLIEKLSRKRKRPRKNNSRSPRRKEMQQSDLETPVTKSPYGIENENPLNDDLPDLVPQGDWSYHASETSTFQEIADDAGPGVSHLPSPSLLPNLLQPGRKHLRRHLKARDDILPEGPAPLPAEDDLLPDPEAPSVSSTVTNERRRFLQIAGNVRLILVETVTTHANSFGLFRKYYGRPSRIPDELISTADVTANSLHNTFAGLSLREAIWPYPNISSWRLGSWFWTQGDTKSQTGFKSLVNDVLLAPDFNLNEIRDIPWKKIDELLADVAPRSPEGAGWKQADVEIWIPTGIKVKPNERGKGGSRGVSSTPKFTVSGLWYRSITQLIRSVFSEDAVSLHFHFNPYKQFIQRSDGSLERVRDELYNSDAWIKEHEHIQSLPRQDDNDTYPRCIAAIMCWSDATHLAQFGDAKLWPMYLFFGNLSKWIRCKSSSQACHHIAYLPTLPDRIIEFIRQHVGSGAVEALKTHCRRELFHSALRFLFDQDFVLAWKEGLIIQCADGNVRRVFPRIFTWSADYPEKVLLASIRDLGGCPCPRCLIQKNDIPKMGMVSDRNTRRNKFRTDDPDRQHKIQTARKFIYRKGYVVNSEAVEAQLKEYSLTPNENALSTVLYPLGFNFHQLFVCDLMHEIELGVWKSLFVHLIRILHTLGGTRTDELNARFRLMPAFGKSTIRRFGPDVSEMKKLAARDFEDILQCAMPGFEGLFPAHSEAHIQNLLWTMAYWHGLAKLRVHTDTTLDLLDKLTTTIGKLLRDFQSIICPHFETFDTPAEMRARARAVARNVSTARTEAHATAQPAEKTFTSKNARKRRFFNLKTYKFHAMGDYVSDIRNYGTTDGYSTQIGELEHRIAKSRYRHRTNKNQFTAQLTKLAQRAENIRKIAQKLQARMVQHHEHLVPFDPTGNEASEPMSPDEMYHIAKDQRKPLYLGPWLRQYPGDPACKQFIPRLKDHILSRIYGLGGAGEEREFTDSERARILFQHERIFSHAIVRVNYTTYDLRRDQDYINPSTSKCFVMVASNEDDEGARELYPFWYAKVLGIFHANVLIASDRHHCKPERIEFLWVRWFGRDPSWRSGWQHKRLDRIGFIPQEDPEAFGFLDPHAIIRGAHLIPAFAYGRTVDLCAPSIGRDDEGDWVYYYVNRFVDRDMLMRHLGGGIGHKGLPQGGQSDWSNGEDLPEADNLLYTVLDGDSVSSETSDADISSTKSENDAEVFEITSDIGIDDELEGMVEGGEDFEY